MSSEPWQSAGALPSQAILKWMPEISSSGHTWPHCRMAWGANTWFCTMAPQAVNWIYYHRLWAQVNAAEALQVNGEVNWKRTLLTEEPPTWLENDRNSKLPHENWNNSTMRHIQGMGLQGHDETILEITQIKYRGYISLSHENSHPWDFLWKLTCTKIAMKIVTHDIKSWRTEKHLRPKTSGLWSDHIGD